MKNSLLVLGVATLFALWQQNKDLEASVNEFRLAPEFPSQDQNRWINCTSLKMTSNGENGLRDKVVLLNVWTFM